MFLAFVFILFGTQSVLAQLSTTTESSKCSEAEFRCRNGACIPGAGRCNGIIECADKSDEIFALCRNNTCRIDEFRCTYGACMQLSVRCNDKQDCPDNSDELVPLCRNDFTDFNICEERLMEERQLSRAVECRNLRQTCDNGQVLPEPTRCDGHVDCADGSDETVARCAEAECVPPLFRCAYGGCAYPKAQCDDVVDCPDGSDESYELCGRILPPTTTTTPKPVCTLPPQPDHGSYSMGGKIQGVPGQQFKSFILNFRCDPPYGLVGESSLFCSMGEWYGELPKCVHFCRLPKHHSVEYRCPLSSDATEGTRECNEREPAGTMVRPRCRLPVFYYPGLMLNMHCNESGRWDQIVTCIPECGKLGSAADALLLQGREAMRNELPWHVAIYRRPHHVQMCAGTVVRPNIVISAAHCFWRRGKLQPVSNYVVAAGKLYRAWNHPKDVNTMQTSEIREIILPARFQGSATNFQDDIALLILVSNLQYTSHVRPVCIDFDYAFDSRQLKVLSVGKVAGWGLTERGNYSDTLRVADVPFVSIQDCIADTPEEFKVYITSDKICAGYKNGTALCKGDSGGGLTFPARERGTYRYYLRGVASTGFNNRVCNSATITSFTHVVTHQQFLLEYL